MQHRSERQLSGNLRENRKTALMRLVRWRSKEEHKQRQLTPVNLWFRPKAPIHLLSMAALCGVSRPCIIFQYLLRMVNPQFYRLWVCFYNDYCGRESITSPGVSGIGGLALTHMARNPGHWPGCIGIFKPLGSTFCYPQHNKTQSLVRICYSSSASILLLCLWQPKQFHRNFHTRFLRPGSLA